jgi:hypothetical protein
MSNKTFTIVGTSNLRGKIKFRFANGSIKNRIAVLARNEHTEVDLLELPEPMTKTEAKDYFIKVKARANEAA